jgi:hypothetical protein
MSYNTKEQVLQAIADGELSYIDAIMQLEEIGFEPKEAEEIVDEAFKWK